MAENLNRSIAGEKYFRWRGKDVSRTENLSDIIFAMALTLIVVSSVPASFTELTGLWREAIAITLCFAMLLMIWRVHYVFFRRYDLEDGTVMFLNSILILMVMLFAYPLKFLSSFLVTYLTDGFATGEDISAVLSEQQIPLLLIVFSLGYAAVFLVFTLMYVHALKRSEHLDLSPVEVLQTRNMVKANALRVVIAGIVIAMAMFVPGEWHSLIGWFYLVGGIVLDILRHRDLRFVKVVFENSKTA
ncbi:MAG: DUF1211 domain-containing protein [Robiginitomaculum sp.]|nr:DUF1211 domain-containing protein [Robiginitomaculum sp.]